MKYIYTHLYPQKFDFSNEFSSIEWTFTELPAYVQDSIAQIKKYAGVDPVLVSNDWINANAREEFLDFFNICKTNMPSLYRDAFWFLTLSRLYALFLYCKKENITKFIHLEYDNLIYSNFENFNLLKPGIYFTKVGPKFGSAGFVYCNSLEHFEEFINRLKHLLLKGQSVLNQVTQEGFISEMVLINVIAEHTTDVIDFLPILPFGPGSNNFDILKTVYDCASYGQYIGGTNNGHAPGWAGAHHYIGEQLLQKNIDVIFDNNVKKPYLKYNNELIPIHNLHVHSKKLNLFI
jgi:hypothetical protein